MDESGETEGPALAAVASQRSSGGTNFSIGSYPNHQVLFAGAVR